MNLNEKTIQYRINKGIASKGFAHIITVAVQLVSVPVFLSQWGSELYGIWIMVSTLPAYLILSGFGFSRIAANKMTMCNAGNDILKANQFFQSGWFVITILSICIFVLIYTMLEYFPFNTTKEIVTEQSLRYTLLYLSAYTLISLQGGFISAGYSCNEYFFISVLSDSFIRLIENCILFYVVFASSNMEHAAASLCFSRAFLVAVNYLAMKKFTPWLSFGIKHVKFYIIKELIKPSLSYMAITLTQALNLQGMTLIVGYLMGPVYVVVFNTARTLSRLGVQMISMMNQVLMPELSALLSIKNIVLAQKIVISSGSITLYGAIGFFIFISFFGQDIISVWTSDSVKVMPPFLLLLTIVPILHSLWNNLSIALISINMHKSFALLYLAISIFSLLLAYFTIGSIGLYGAAIAIITMNLLTVLVMWPLALQILEISSKQYLVSIVLPIRN
ncbi:MAG: lipopolysaccharide biosynthesis protein [Colwellia sp.]|nr:lipopolysaccharide biosynthesis protein [Colwellia sp.]